MLQIIGAMIRGRPKNGGNDTTEVDLIFGNVNAEDILLKDSLYRLAREGPEFRMYYILNKPSRTGTVVWASIVLAQSR